MSAILITGGAGFIGINAADYFASRGWSVTVLDNLSRRGAAENLAWLRQRHQFKLEQGDVRDYDAVCRIMATTAPRSPGTRMST